MEIIYLYRESFQNVSSYKLSLYCSPLRQDLRVKMDLRKLIQLSHLKLSKQWSKSRSHHLWSLQHIQPSHFSHLTFILIHYLSLSPSSPNVVWPLGSFKCHRRAPYPSQLLLSPQTCCCFLVIVPSATRCYSWFGCHLTLFLILPPPPPLPPTPISSLDPSPSLKSLYYQPISGHQWLNHHNSLLSSHPDLPLAHVQVQSHLLRS